MRQEQCRPHQSQQQEEAEIGTPGAGFVHQWLYKLEVHSSLRNDITYAEQQLKMTGRRCSTSPMYVTSVRGYSRSVTPWKLVLLSSLPSYWDSLFYKWKLYVFWEEGSCNVWDPMQILWRHVLIVMEHKPTVRVCDRSNGIAVHAWNEVHTVDWEVVHLEPSHCYTNSTLPVHIPQANLLSFLHPLSHGCIKVFWNRMNINVWTLFDGLCSK